MQRNSDNRTIGTMVLVQRVVIRSLPLMNNHHYRFVRVKPDHQLVASFSGVHVTGKSLFGYAALIHSSLMQLKI